MNRRSIRSCITSTAVLVVLAGAAPAFAGPPLLCHPFDIAGARSLPWDGTRAWWQGDARYDVAGLIRDTEALLTPSTPVIVRMETLRRAAIYASSDREIASRLLATLTDKARASEQSGRPDALAFLDAAYVTGAFREIGMLAEMPQFRPRVTMIRTLVAGADAYALIGKSLSLGAGDPAIEFAAALIAADSSREAYQRHAHKARAGAGKDSLLARNLAHIS
jgi:hypothetical protein